MPQPWNVKLEEKEKAAELRREQTAIEVEWKFFGTAFSIQSKNKLNKNKQGKGILRNTFKHHYISKFHRFRGIGWFRLRRWMRKVDKRTCVHVCMR